MSYHFITHVGTLFTNILKSKIDCLCKSLEDDSNEKYIEDSFSNSNDSSYIRDAMGMNAKQPKDDGLEMLLTCGC